MPRLENISFDEALQNASIARVYDVSVPFLHIDQLIKNKKTTNWPKDIIDVIRIGKNNQITSTEKDMI